MSSLTLTTHHGNILSLLELLNSYGVDNESLAATLSLDISQLRSKSIRLNAEQLDELITMALELTDDPLLPIHFAEYVHPTTYHALGMSLLSSVSLRDYWQRLHKFFALVSTITSLSLELDGESPYVEFRALVKHPETTRHFHSTTIVAVLIKMIRQIFRPNYTPHRLQLMGQINLATEQQYVDHFGCAIEYNCDSTRIFLNRDELDLALPAANAELCRQLDGLVIKYLETLSKTSLTAKVKELLIASLPANNFARESIAKQLYMSPRTFHDKLKKEKTSFQQLLDETRQELACRYLEEMKVPVGELTHLLGFADSSSFTRAFKRWYGVAPSRYKKTLSSSS